MTENHTFKEKFGSQLIKDLAAELLIDEEDLDPTQDIMEYGVDSMAIAQLATALEDRYGFSLEATDVFEADSIDVIIDTLYKQNKTTIISYHRKYS